MKKINLLLAIALSAAVVFSAPNKVIATGDEPAKADNSRMNKEENRGLTAEQQKMNESDREITRKIRRAVVKDKSLSMKAHNVKIIARDGMVTLKGSVKTEKEKDTIEQIAERTAGKGNITNELTVAR